MKRTKILLSAMLLAIGPLLFTACKKDKKTESNDEEVITTLTIKLTPVGGGTTLSYSFDDPDGPGGLAPTIDEIVLAPSTTYNAEIELLNKTVSPPENITEEVEEEAEAHRFYFEVQGGANLTIDNLDTDANGVPLGINSTWTTGAASTGKVQVTLRHYPNTPPGKAMADPVNSPKSETDISTVDIGGFTLRIL
ncbi:MAG TPA: hypothetical protein PKC39_00225 [Ferruginibacter sp.]|nr:hypothetical protein [Ferruginibacter sp.]HMP19355.1 hypothetical protein [Ferruginibacter sp.]